MYVSNQIVDVYALLLNIFALHYVGDNRTWAWACLLVIVMPLKRIVSVLVYAPPFILCVSKSHRWLSLMFTNYYIVCALPNYWETLLGLAL